MIDANTRNEITPRGERAGESLRRNSFEARIASHQNNMSEKNLRRFENLIKDHRSSWHPLFSQVESAASDNTLTPEAYLLFSVNIAARTMLSLPEIHACCIQASLDLDPLRTAFSVMTGAEEGGFGKPAKVHTVLMMNALNYHGQIAFDLPSIDLQRLMALVRLVHTARRYRVWLEINKNDAAGVGDRLQRAGFVDPEELADTTKRMANIAGLYLPEPWETPDQMRRIEDEAFEDLMASKVLPETVDYCLAQLDVLGKMQAGYLQGVGFAHEGLADGMIYKMFRILYRQIDRYASRKEFMERVYPYFSAHGNYLEVFNGASDHTDGVEVIHAQRELAKLAQLDEAALKTAWIGANDFAERNVLIWDGLVAALNASSHEAILAEVAV